jgi:threonine synthase
VDANYRFGDSVGFRLNLLTQDFDVPGRNGVSNSHWGIAPSLEVGIGDNTNVNMDFYRYETDDMPDYSIPYSRNATNTAPAGEPIETNPENFYGLTVAVSRAAGRGAEAVICASTGNTAASAAAYAARAGMRGAVIVPEGKIAIGKLAQALMHGARVIAIRGNFDDALTLVRELAQKHPIELVNSVNPYRIEGQKTAAYEVVEELGEAPGALAIPVGNAGNITAWWRGFGEQEQAPRLYGFQAEGASPLVSGKPVANPETVASAIRIGNPARWEEAMTAVTQSRGRIAAVTDDQILEAYRLLASREGVFCEPASAASVAGILNHGLPVVDGDSPPESVVCVLTGHGLKDPDTALGKAPAVVGCENDLAEVERAVFD